MMAQAIRDKRQRGVRKVGHPQQAGLLSRGDGEGCVSLICLQVPPAVSRLHTKLIWQRWWLGLVYGVVGVYLEIGTPYHVVSMGSSTGIAGPASTRSNPGTAANR